MKLGTKVIYRLNDNDVAEINKQRAQSSGDYASVDGGDEVVGFVTAAHAAECADLHLLLPGTDSLYVSSRPAGHEPGTFEVCR